MVSTHYGGEVELLRSHYKGLPNDESLVAFVDESYRLPGERSLVSRLSTQ